MGPGMHRQNRAWLSFLRLPDQSTTTMKPLLLLLLALPVPVMAQPCGLWGNSPGQLGGCTVNDSTGRPAVRITEPYPGTGYRSQPVPGYRPVNSSPYLGAPPSYRR